MIFIADKKLEMEKKEENKNMGEIGTQAEISSWHYLRRIWEGALMLYLLWFLRHFR